MPPRKRTSQISPTSTVSTSHVSPDQHHHLRHTGPSISTRTGAGAAPSKHPPAGSVQRTPTSENPPNEKHPAAVSPPGVRTSFTRFMYVLLFVLLILLGWYIWGIAVFLERLKEEAGWWGIVAGDSGGTARWGSSGSGSSSERSGGELEASLGVLADALGVSPVQVASAVRPLVPQASLASIASKMEGTGGSEAVRVLFEDTAQCSRDHKMPS